MKRSIWLLVVIVLAFAGAALAQERTAGAGRVEIGAFPGGGYKLASLPFKVQECKYTDTESQKGHRNYYYLRCQTFKNQLSSGEFPISG